MGNLLNQNFAAALDNQLISVPSIDYKTYPDGIPGGQGADLTGGFTIQSARTLATLLRYGPLSVNLVARWRPPLPRDRNFYRRRLVGTL